MHYIPGVYNAPFTVNRVIVGFVSPLIPLADNIFDNLVLS